MAHHKSLFLSLTLSLSLSFSLSNFLFVSGYDWPLSSSQISLAGTSDGLVVGIGTKQILDIKKERDFLDVAVMTGREFGSPAKSLPISHRGLGLKGILLIVGRRSGEERGRERDDGTECDGDTLIRYG